MINPLDRLSGYNPLRGLDLGGLVNLIEQGERGYYADLQWLYRLILRRNATARAVRRKLQGALGRLDWDIKVRDDVADFNEALAEKQKAALRSAYEQIGNLREAWTWLAMADILEFSPLVKVYAGNLGAVPRQLPRNIDPWAIVELRCVPRWNLCREGLFAPWTYNPDARLINSGVPLNEHWIIREVDDPAAEIFAFAHVKMSVTDADWDQFCDTYAVPPIFIEGPPNVAKEKEREYQATANNIVSDGRGYIPNGAKVHSLEVNGDGVAFTSRLRFYREEIVLAGTGGILTTLDGNTGIGKGPAEEHDDTWLDIAAEVAADVSATLNEQLDRGILERAFPGEPQFAYFDLQKPKKDTSPTIVLGDAKAARDAGLQIDSKELSEKSGYTLTPIPPAEQPNPPIHKPEIEGAALPMQRAGSPAEPSQTPESRPAVDGPAKPPEPAAVPEAPAAVEDLPPAKDARASRFGEAKPSLVQAALADSLDVEARWLDPVKQQLDEIEAMILDGRPADEVAAKIEAVIAAAPDLLGQLDSDALAKGIENATGPAAIEGLRDALAAQPVPKR